MANVNAAADLTQAEILAGKNDPPSSPQAGAGGPGLHGGSKVYMSGPLFLSSKGIGWTSWKKRWFILTNFSLVFYRSDPNAAPQKVGEVNLTLGGIDLNSSGSVVVKEDKKLITVAFPDGRDGRTFTLKAEALEDLYKWKNALQEAIASAPTASPLTDQNGSKTEPADDVSSEQPKEKQPAKYSVLGRPILLALEDVDGTPSFLEKALRFVEDHGVKTEGILRQAADVELVERRFLEYEKGRTEFSPDEDAHVIGDCIKYILREMPSSPIPASCCKALVEAHRTERHMRLNAIRTAICETFPEPNRRLLQRILEMMEAVAANKDVNRMSVAAVAACMAPLLLRPLLAGECETDGHIDVGDSSVQLLQAAAAANHAQAIVITMLDEFNNIFGEGDADDEPYTDSDESEEITDDEEYDDDEDDYVTEGSDDEEEDDNHESRASDSGTSEDQSDDQASESSSSNSNSPKVAIQDLPSSPDAGKVQSNNSSELMDDDSELSLARISSELSKESARGARRRAVWGRAPAKKDLSKDSIDASSDDEADTQKLDTQNGVYDEAMVKSLLKNIVKKRKNDLHEWRLDLQKDVVRLQDQLHKETNLRAALEAGLRNSQLPSSIASLFDKKMKAELEEIVRAEAEVLTLKRKVVDLELQLSEQREKNAIVWHDKGLKPNHNLDDQQKLKMKRVDSGGLVTSKSAESLSTSKDESPSSLALSPPNNLQMDAAQNQKVLAVVKAFALEPGGNKLTAMGSKKSTVKGEGPGSSSALSKLTNRLNFLKERSALVANEIQSLNIGRSLSRPGENRRHSVSSELPQSPENSNKHQESKGWSFDSESNEMQQNPNSHAPAPHKIDFRRKSKKHQSLEKRKA